MRGEPRGQFGAHTVRVCAVWGGDGRRKEREQPQEAMARATILVFGGVGILPVKEAPLSSNTGGS